MPVKIPRLFKKAPKCDEKTMRRRQTESDKNGNRGRWHYSCRVCPRMVFDDWEGIREGNPFCDCDTWSRKQMELGEYVFRCARNECDYMENA